MEKEDQPASGQSSELNSQLLNTPTASYNSRPGSPDSSATLRPTRTSRKTSVTGFLNRVRTASIPSSPNTEAYLKSPNQAPKSPSSLKSFASFASSLTRRKTSGRPSILKFKHPLQHRTDLPPWDRTVDIVYHNYPRDSGNRPDKDREFEKSIGLFYKENGRERPKPSRESSQANGIFGLPDSVRLRIWRNVISMTTTDKTIGLTGRPWMKDAWRGDEFAALGDVLQPLAPYLALSFEFRADVMVALLMTKRFHVTFSPFVGQILNPLAVLWLEKYAPYMQNLTVEVDMTRLGFSHFENADILPPGILHMKEHIKGLVKALKKRRKATTMESLILLCRRYYRNRRRESSPRRMVFQTTQAETGEKLPYFAESNFYICDPFKSLRHLVDSTRICGFTKAYSVTLMKAIFSLPPKENLRYHTYNVAPSTAYPRLPGQKAFVDDGRGCFLLEEHTEDSRPESGERGGAVMLPPPAVGRQSSKAWSSEKGQENRDCKSRKRFVSTLSGGSSKMLGSAPMWMDGFGERIQENKTKVKALMKRFSMPRLRRAGSI